MRKRLIRRSSGWNLGLPVAVSVFLLILSIVACSEAGEEGVEHTHDDTTHTHAEAEATRTLTLWNDQVELFMEYPVLEVGAPAKFAVHLTRMSDFKPVQDGTLLLHFTAPQTEPKAATARGTETPGIYGPTVSFDAAGDYRLRIEILTDDFETALTYEPIRVTVEAETVEGEVEDEPITYLKEQQWSLPFSTQVVAERELEATIRAPATIIPRAGNETIVTATLPGRFFATEDGPARIGETTREGQVLGVIELLPTDESAVRDSRISVERAVSELTDRILRGEAEVRALETSLELARKEHGRVSRLVSAGALPEKRLETAAAELEIQRSALEAAERSLSHHRERMQRLEPTPAETAATRRFVLAAPIAGAVVETGAAAGSYVRPGDLLYRIVDLNPVWVRGQVYERDAQKLGTISGATLELPGGSSRDLPPGSLVAVGKRLDETTRTLPVTWEVPNRDHNLTLGSVATLQLRLGRRRTVLAVPQAAVLLEEAREVAYVQLGGESFQRRIITTGIRDRGWVEVVEGLREGERVVVEGAYDVALAARSTEVPEHGHVH